GTAQQVRTDPMTASSCTECHTVQLGFESSPGEETMAQHRSIQLLAGQSRNGASNARTAYVFAAAQPAPPDFEALFAAHYPAFASECRQYDQPGLCVVAIHQASRRLACIARLPVDVAPHAAILGRHGQA